jgi:hypothetical protein
MGHGVAAYPCAVHTAVLQPSCRSNSAPCSRSVERKDRSLQFLAMRQMSILSVFEVCKTGGRAGWCWRELWASCSAVAWHRCHCWGALATVYIWSLHVIGACATLCWFCCEFATVHARAGKIYLTVMQQDQYLAFIDSLLRMPCANAY